MNMKEEILPYIDGSGLVSPRRLGTSVPDRSSDNGTLFLTDWLICLITRGQDDFNETFKYITAISSCLNSHGNLCRAPGATDQDSVDNHYAVFAGHRLLNLTSIPQAIKKGMFGNLGFTNNENPGTVYKEDGKTINWDAFLVRQPQLMAAMMSASQSKRFYHAPLYWYAAFVLTTSCSRIDRMAEYYDESKKQKLPLMERFKGLVRILKTGEGVPTGNTDARRLSFLLGLTVEKDSLLCRYAMSIWRRRLIRHYGNEGMRAVNTIYFGPDHPIAVYSPQY